VVVAPGPPADLVSSFNLLTTTTSWRWPRQRLGFLVARQRDVTARLVGMLSGPEQLRVLNFLHTARWVDVGHFPHVADGQPRERRSTRSVLFCSNFNGDRDTYIRCFMEAFPEGVYDIWAPSLGWPGFPRPGTSNVLFGWVMDRFIRSEHDYRAYPHATTNDVRAALAVRREVRSLVADLRTADGSDPSPWTAAALDELASRVQHCLGQVDAPTAGAWPPAASGGSIHGLVTLLPIRAGSEAAVRAAIEKFRPGQQPVRPVPGTTSRLGSSVTGRQPEVRDGGCPTCPRAKQSGCERPLADAFDAQRAVGTSGVDADDGDDFGEKWGTCPVPESDIRRGPHTVLGSDQQRCRDHPAAAAGDDQSTFESILAGARRRLRARAWRARREEVLPRVDDLRHPGAVRRASANRASSAPRRRDRSYGEALAVAVVRRICANSN
jgi:hypothetical protein